ncbi:MAG: hypothetical protein ABW167_07650 [Baekduia sp.]
MLLPVLFHWSPGDRRQSIIREGLKPYSPTTVSTREASGEVVVWPYVCLSPAPATAWGLSGDMGWASAVDVWDLWQVRLTGDDEVHVRSEWGNHLREIRVRNAIPPDRVWWCGRREELLAEPAA